jgi:hypothetical protein
MAPEKDTSQEKDPSLLGDFVRMAVLFWSVAMLSLNYLGYVKAMDPTFPASLLTGTMASFGVSVGKGGGQNKKDDPKVEPTQQSKPKV